MRNKNRMRIKKIAVKKNSRFNVFKFVTKKKKGLMSGAGTMNQPNKKKKKGLQQSSTYQKKKIF